MYLKAIWINTQSSVELQEILYLQVLPRLNNLLCTKRFQNSKIDVIRIEIEQTSKIYSKKSL